MGKTPKKAAPGGDERNLYVRRLKATTVPSRASESSFLPERQRESESLNRPKLTGIQKKIPTGSGKSFKNKLRTPAKVGLSQTTKQLKLPMRNPETKTTEMQSESEEAEVKLNVSIQKEHAKEEKLTDTNKTTEIEELAVDKECVVQDAPEQTLSEPQNSTKIVQEIIFMESEIISQGKEGVSLENILNTGTKDAEEQEENEIELILQTEQSPTKDGKEKLNDERPMDDSKGEELPVVQDELKNAVNDKEDLQNTAQTDAESNSADIVESTRSEVLETSESVTQYDTQKNKEKTDDNINNDASFISYDSSIMLKDVQIRLNDCLKDNSKLFDVTEDVPYTNTNQLTRGMSFGMTLRNISGRHSISRMHHMPLRERRISPNSSLFVNTSTMSIPQDEGTECKVLHYNSDISDSFPTNGRTFERKRKIETSTWSSTKKQKTEAESNFLNTSMGLLKDLYRPIQVSTPNATPYKFESIKLDISGIKDDDNKITDTAEGTKKWCVIM